MLEQNGSLTIRMHLLGHKGEDGLGVVKCLRSTGGTRIFTVIGQFLAPTEVTDGVTDKGGGDGRYHLKRRKDGRALGG